MFDAPTQGQPVEFVGFCSVIGRDPTKVLDSYDAPSRWLIAGFNTSGVITEAARALTLSTGIQRRLNLTRE